MYRHPLNNRLDDRSPLRSYPNLCRLEHLMSRADALNNLDQAALSGRAVLAVINLPRHASPK